MIVLWQIYDGPIRQQPFEHGVTLRSAGWWLREHFPCGRMKVTSPSYPDRELVLEDEYLARLRADGVRGLDGL